MEYNPRLVKERRFIEWITLLVVLAVLTVITMISVGSGLKRTTTVEGIDLLASYTVEEVVINDGTQTASMTLTKDYGRPKRYLLRGGLFGIKPGPVVGKEAVFVYARSQMEIVATAIAKADPQKGYDLICLISAWWGSMLTLMIPMLLSSGPLFWFASWMSGGISSLGPRKSRVWRSNKKDETKITFADVTGVNEAAEGLQEIREFLVEPDKFHKPGVKAPKDVLLYGPPGTGRTLSAKAVIGEAGMPFFSTNGPEFVETFVSMGASRVWDLFEQARNAASMIIFVGEIDAVGRHRGIGIGEDHDEREQTPNRLLVEMDDFDERTNIILIVATNRLDAFSPALLRPGRSNWQVAAEAPDIKGREAILTVRVKNKPLSKDADLEVLTKCTLGFIGVDLANALDEAALLTVRHTWEEINANDLDEAADQVVVGPQKHSRIMDDYDKLATTHHEGEHALCTAVSSYPDPVTKVIILPHGRVLGYAMAMPTEDRYPETRSQLLDQLVYTMSGRVVEEVVFRDPSTGAASDIEKTIEIARKMTTRWGLSTGLGAVKYGSSHDRPFVGMECDREPGYSDATAATTDQEIQQPMEVAHREVWWIIENNRDILDELVRRLLGEETLDKKILAEIFAGVIKPTRRGTWQSYPGLRTANHEPIEIPEVVRIRTVKALGATSDNSALDATNHLLVEADLGGIVPFNPGEINSVPTTGSILSNAPDPTWFPKPPADETRILGEEEPYATNPSSQDSPDSPPLLPSNPSSTTPPGGAK